MDNYIQLDKEDEISGSLTFAKYWYQYNWALIKFLEESESNDDCSLSIECHEDVMIIDNDDPKTSKVELYQVKERSLSANYTASSLAYSSASETTKSVISKLVKNLDKPHLKDRIKRLALVSATPFNLDIDGNAKSEELYSFSWEQIKKADKDILLASLKKDLGKDEVPLFIEFIKGSEGHTEEVHSSIAFKKMCEYIEDLLPNMAHKPKVVFELLRSQLIKIGTDTKRYSLWSDFTKNKTISANQLNTMINKRSVPMSSNAFDDLWRDVKQENYVKSLKFTDQAKLKKEAKSYHDKRLISVDTVFIDVANIVSHAVNFIEFDDYSKCVEHIISEINNSLSLKEYFDSSDLKIKAAAVVELSECL
ncbi:dsDNA nuclease domain-containing protein [Vibrio cyclitrophicus]|uniref:dsDNA nuclease domain-containing protein n=1 Tax=Vibrio cyclitrophicus TaxID=47951 RepID=UPI0002FD3CCE|nr:dsDNA nuclease domain-containing protein [Vibrio cyclitrophicus]OED63734.1 hypothetical protein OAU_17775 [Vibrio cyclitrophicus ZF99]